MFGKKKQHGAPIPVPAHIQYRLTMRPSKLKKNSSISMWRPKEASKQFLIFVWAGLVKNLQLRLHQYSMIAIDNDLGEAGNPYTTNKRFPATTQSNLQCLCCLLCLTFFSTFSCARWYRCWHMPPFQGHPEVPRHFQTWHLYEQSEECGDVSVQKALQKAPL